MDGIGLDHQVGWGMEHLMVLIMISIQHSDMHPAVPQMWKLICLLLQIYSIYVQFSTVQEQSHYYLTFCACYHGTVEAENFCKHIFHVVCATVQIRSHYYVTFCNWHKQDSGKCSHYICTAVCSVQRRSHYVTLATASVAPPCDNSPYRRNIIVQYMCKWMLPKHYGAMQVQIWVQLYALYAPKLAGLISWKQVSINWSMALIMNWVSMNWF